MTTLKNGVDLKISTMVANSTAHRTIARRLFLYDFSYVFSNDQDRGFIILDAIREHFDVSFSSIKIVGSAQLGYSYTSKRDFSPGESDLDIAIISPNLFQKYSELVFQMTDRYYDLSKFPRDKDSRSMAKSFREYLSSGYFRPDMMPQSPEKSSWFGFFNRLSSQHTVLFNNINAGIHLSECFFEVRNTSVIREHRKALK